MYMAGFHTGEGGRKLGSPPYRGGWEETGIPPKDLSFAQVQNFKKSVFFKISHILIYIRLETTTFEK